MPNFNDAEISRIYVTQTGVDVQDNSPNAAPPGPPAANFDVRLEMTAGGGVGGKYTLFTIAYDVTTGDNQPLLDPPAAGRLNGGNEDFGVDPPWALTGNDRHFDEKETIAVPAAAKNHIFYYTVALVSDNAQIVDFAQSDFFILL